MIQPPPTANIPRGPPPQTGSPAPQGPPLARPSLGGPVDRPVSPPSPGTPRNAQFAPNAFTSGAQYSAAPTFGEPNWYDRILDALLGEDETSAKNRFALICSNCRLVNGQAPPGAKSLEDVGKWRCIACGVMNGVENETAKLVKEVLKEDVTDKPGAKKDAVTRKERAAHDEDKVEDWVDAGEGHDEDEEEDSKAVDEAGAETPSQSTRSKAKGKKGKKS